MDNLDDVGADASKARDLELGVRLARHARLHQALQRLPRVNGFSTWSTNTLPMSGLGGAGAVHTNEA